MSVTLKEVVFHCDRLRREIVERECLLAAFNVLHKYMTGDPGSQPVELGALVGFFPSALPDPAVLERSAALPPPTPPAALPQPPPEPPYVHPELKEMGRFATNVQVVRWAIARMTEDYSLHDIKALLQREGRSIEGEKISTVLTRMRCSGEVEEIERSYGPIPARLRKPGSAVAVEANPADQIDNTAARTAAVAAAVE